LEKIDEGVEMKIRKATLRDLKGIGELMKTEFNKPPYEDGWTDSSVRRTVRNYLRIGYGFVAIEGKEIVGAVIVKNDYYAKGLSLVIEELIVKSECQGKGIGSKLVKEIEKIAKKKKAHTVYLYTSKKSRAFKFYKRLGYEESEHMATMGKKLK
jgi:aminoglycoside 6'-N-acetyltransferase I